MEADAGFDSQIKKTKRLLKIIHVEYNVVRAECPKNNSGFYSQPRRLKQGWSLGHPKGPNLVTMGLGSGRNNGEFLLFLIIG